MGRVICALVAAMVLLVSCGQSDNAATTSSTTTTTTTTVSLAEAMSAWLQLASPTVKEIGGNLQWIGGAVQGMDYADARAGCRALKGAVDRMEALQPAPSPDVSEAMDNSISEFRALAEGCQGISPGTSKTEMEELLKHAQQGAAELTRASDLATSTPVG